MLPKISVLTAVKNEERFVEESLNSILRQTFTDFELIVVDDYSSDNTFLIIEKLAQQDSRVKVVKNTELPGISHALNLALTIARGKYVARHDADDISHSNRLEKQVAFLEINPEIDILGSFINIVNVEGEFLSLHKEPVTHAAVKLHSLFGTPFAHPTILIRRSFLCNHDIRYLDIPAQDFELWVRMLNAGARAYNISEALVSYRISQTSDSNARYTRHVEFANSIKRREIEIYFQGDLSRLIFTDEFQAIAHHLLTGNLVPENVIRQLSPMVVFDVLKLNLHRFSFSKSEVSVTLQMLKERVLLLSSSYQKRINFLTKISLLNKIYFNKPKAKRITLAKGEIHAFISAVPIFINVRDRLTCLTQLINWLEAAGHENIILIDNASTYPPLLAFLNRTHHKVIRTEVNLGHTALWNLPQLKPIIQGNWFVYTDPDVIPSENCHHDAVGRFYEILLNHSHILKVGFGLKIDDIPDHYHLKNQVIKWEKNFYKNPISNEEFYADIDTTFALYRPGTQYCAGPGIRTMGFYQARHQPWYLNSKNLSSEEQYYRNHAMPSITTWNVIGDVKPLRISLNKMKYRQFIKNFISKFSVIKRLITS